MIHPWQIAVITLYAFIQPNETRSFNIGMSMPILAGWFTGLLLGNPQTGLVLGGTLQLMTLGVNTYGGTSIPNTTVGAIVGTALSLNSTPELALGIAIPVALLMIQLDILARYANIFFLHRADHFIDERNYDKAAFQNLLGMIAPGLSRAVPVFFVLCFGQSFVEAVMGWIPQWFMTGLQVAGGVIPVVGICILLNYLPTRSKLPFLILGFLLAAYVKIPLIGVAGFGLVITLLDYMYTRQADQRWAANQEGSDLDE